MMWQQPWWLALAAIPLMLWLLPRRDRSAELEQFIARPLWPRLLTGFREDRNRGINPLFTLAWLLACIALAGPTLLTEAHEDEIKQQANIAIVLDISPSMRVQDVVPNRLEYSKRLLIELAQQLKGQRVALIAFSANAYTVLPLTSDNKVLTQTIEAMDPSLASVTGSNLSRALQLAQQALSASENKGVALLISDGEIHDRGALTTARQLQQAGHRLHTFGVGTESGGPVPFATGRLIDEHNQLVTSQLHRSTLRALAQAGGGDYADLRPEAWPGVMKVVKQLQKPQRNEGHRNGGIQLFPLFLTLALILFLWSGVRRSEIFIVLLCLPLITHSPSGEAALWEDGYDVQIDNGIAAYRLGQWQEALNAFDRAAPLAGTDEERAIAAYNRGNALVQLGRIEEASLAYKSTLFWQPGHPKANHNLALLQRNQPKGGDRKGKSEYQRQGEGDEEDNSRRGDSNGDGETARKQQALQQSLKQWNQRHTTNNGQGSTQPQQQLDTLKEDYQTMLKQRFAAEDVKDAAGLVVERPW